MLTQNTQMKTERQESYSFLMNSVSISRATAGDAGSDWSVCSVTTVRAQHKALGPVATAGAGQQQRQHHVEQ